MQNDNQEIKVTEFEDVVGNTAVGGVAIYLYSTTDKDTVAFKKFSRGRLVKNSLRLMSKKRWEELKDRYYDVCNEVRLREKLVDILYPREPGMWGE